MATGLDDLDWTRWNAANPGDRAHLVAQAAARVGGIVSSLGSHIVVRGVTLALVPGGEVTLGWDGSELSLDADRRASWIAEAEVEEDSFEAFLRMYLGPRRTVTLAPFLVETTASPTEEFVRDKDADVETHVRSVIASDGFRLLTNDEWEAAARAGTSTVFAWGDEWPDGAPYFTDTTWTRHREPNALGLVLGDDPYAPEIVDELEWLRHGDGGTAVCGGRPSPEAWYSFALAFQYPRALWEDVVTETYETTRVRRALSL